MIGEGKGEIDRSIDVLNGFLRGEISAVETYRQAMEKLGGSPSQSELAACHRSHEERIVKLRQHIQRLGGEPSKDSGAWGAFTRLFEGGARVFGEKAAIAALEEGEDHGLRLYRGDLDKLDPGSRQLVEMDLLPAQERTHRALSALKHSLH